MEYLMDDEKQYYSLAHQYLNKKDYDKARHYMTYVLNLRYSIYGEIDHVETASVLHQLGDICMSQKKTDDAETFFFSALTMKKNLYPKGHISLNNTLNNYANFLLQQGVFDVSNVFFDEILETEPFLHNQEINDVNKERCVERLYILINSANANLQLNKWKKATCRYKEALNLLCKLNCPVLEKDVGPFLRTTLNRISLY